MKTVTAKVATKLTLTAAVMKAAAALMRFKGFSMAGALDMVAKRNQRAMAMVAQAA